MNREIRFRGRWLGGWVNGDLLRRPSGTFIAKLCNGKFIQWRVDPETIGQFTGLRDKNGDEIYEGDILRMHRPSSQVPEMTVSITFEGGAFWFTGDGYTDCNWHFYDAKDREVISNIHQNPELLERPE